MRVVLTGPKGIGKSTAVRRVMKKLGWEAPAGFFTQRIEHPSGEISLVISTWNGRSAIVARWPSAPRNTRDLLAGLDCDALIRFAHQHLRLLPKGKPVVIDELGVIELQIPEFAEYVLRAFHHPAVLAVIQQRSWPQWTSILGPGHIDRVIRLKRATRRKMPLVIAALFRTRSGAPHRA